MVSKPLEALRFADEWDKLLSTVLWISRHASGDTYLRQIDVPGVDTKFIESHRGILSALLDQQLPAERVDHTRPPSDFAGRYRFRTKPDYVRFRWLGHRNGYTEMSVQITELGSAPPDCSTVFVIENEITYLAFPPPERSLVIFGGGYAVPRLNRLSWLTDRDLRHPLEEQGLVTHDTERPPLDHRFIAVDPTTGAECTVEVFADGGRLHDRVTLDIGPVLHPDDLAADKMLALWGRARPRDFFDVAALIDRYGHERLLELAEAKDGGFTHKMFIDALRAIARVSNVDWAEDGITSDDAQRLRAIFDAWRNQLELDTT